MDKLLLNCPNCGAPLTPDGYCSYCNTKVRYANEIETKMILGNNKTIQHILPTEILLKFKAEDGTMLVLPFWGSPESISVTYDEQQCVGFGGHIVATIPSQPSVVMEWKGSLLPYG